MNRTLFDDETPVKPKVTALAPWFGSNRMLAHEVGKELKGCRWVGVPFAGGMTELLGIPKGATCVVNDLHRHIINLARVVAHPTLGPQLYRRLRRHPFHEDIHRVAKTAAELWGGNPMRAVHPDCDIDAAEQYFVAVWMGRSARAGMSSEFSGGPCTRWTGNGGSSATRYRSAASGLREWRQVLCRCDFVVMDAVQFLERCVDAERSAVYCDPPFPGPGDRYKHTMDEQQHRDLAAKLATLKKTRVVCRFYDHPLIRELYPEPRWTWRRLKGRDQANNGEKPEVLIINGPSYAGPT